jgi:predicted PurR-regulated permease PerM
VHHVDLGSVHESADQPAAEPSSSSSASPAEAEVPAGEINWRGTALAIITIAVTIALLRYMQEVFVPLAIGTLLFYALGPLVDGMQRWHLPRPLGAVVALGLVVISLGALAYTLQGQASEVASGLPAGARRFRTAMQTPAAAPSTLKKVDEAAKELQKDAPADKTNVVKVEVQDPPFKASDYLWSGSMTAASFLNQMIMILFLTYFLLVADDLFKRKLVEVVGPALTPKKITVKILGDIAAQIQRFLLIQVFTSLLVGVATWLALWAMGVQQAAFWGFLAGVFNSIPYYGPLLVTAALAVVAYLQFGAVSKMLQVAGVALAITTAEGSFLTPTLMGKAAQMNRVAMFAGLLFWTWMWGVWGLLLAVPMMMAVKAVCDHVEDLQPFGRFLGE